VPRGMERAAASRAKPAGKPTPCRVQDGRFAGRGCLDSRRPESAEIGGLPAHGETGDERRVSACGARLDYLRLNGGDAQVRILVQR
jgi:hypothetical protein